MSFITRKHLKLNNVKISKHAISEDKIEELANVANLSKRINLLNNNEETNDSSMICGDFSEYFPQLIWVLRDFTLDKGDKSPKYLFSFKFIIKIYKLESISNCV